ncbi:MAG: biopolymer transporter ExbD [Spirochaetota bacterium]
MKFRRTTKTFDRIDITSLIDVISFLVIYFLINATLEKASSIKIELPRSSTRVARQKKNKDLIITVNKEGRIYLNRDTKPVTLEQLPGKINIFLGNEKDKKGMRSGKVVIRGDKGSDYQTIVKVIDKVNEAGVKRFNLSMIKGAGKK